VGRGLRTHGTKIEIVPVAWVDELLHRPCPRPPARPKYAGLASRDTLKCFRTVKEYSGRRLKCFRTLKQIPDCV